MTLYDIIYIGAGISSLSSINHLLTKTKTNLKILLLEKSDRIGGRIKTLQNGADIGAQWIGPLHKNLLSLVKKSDLKPQFYDDVPTTYDEDNEYLQIQTIMATDPNKLSKSFYTFFKKSNRGFNALEDGPRGAQKWKVKGGLQPAINKLFQKIMKTKCVDPLFNQTVISIKKLENKVYAVKTNNNTFYTRFVVLGVNPIDINSIEIPEIPRSLGRYIRDLRPGNVVKACIILNKEIKIPIEVRPTPRVQNVFKDPEVNQITALITGATSGALKKLNKSERKTLILKELNISPKDTIFYEDSVGHLDNCFYSIPSRNPQTVKAIREQHFGDIYLCSTEMSRHYYGYVEGAIMAGVRVANKLLRKM